jgi:perosamine synthetase
MLTTSEEEWDRLFRLWRHQGMSVSDTVRHSSKEIVFETYSVPGYNFRMTDIQAAVGRTQIAKLPEMIEQRRRLADRYFDLLSRVPDLGLPVQPEWGRTNWQSFCVRLPGRCDQKRVMQSLLDAGIATRRGVMCAHREPPYRSARCVASGGAAGQASALPVSEQAQDHTLLLPLFHEMTSEQQDAVVEALRSAVAA